MKVMLLAGGFGTRLAEFTELIPKPMVTIGERPILWHIMKTFAHFGHNEFVCCLGYKANIVKDYFLNYRALNGDFTVNLETGSIQQLSPALEDWNITLLETGLNTMTGGRIKRAKDCIGGEPFFLTYGDGVADININELLEFHKQQKKMVTITAVRPLARFGELQIKDNMVVSFAEKPQSQKGWINGGYMIIEPEFFELIDGDHAVLEAEPLETVAKAGELAAFTHEGFWQCMDTKRDKDFLEALWARGEAPWQV